MRYSQVRALNEAYVFYEVERCHLHGKEILRTNPKHYIVDLGLRSFVGGYESTDMGCLFENAVYLQLLYMGRSVYAGKLYDREVDFVAIKDGMVAYNQAIDEMFSESARKRELRPLQSIHDSCEKIVVVRQGSYEPDVDGIKIVRAQ